MRATPHHLHTHTYTPLLHAPPPVVARVVAQSLTDDQDVELGGWEPMKQTRELLEAPG